METEDKAAETVTSEKPKNKGRQEWGRKLGKMSKELKIKKEKESTLDITPNASETDHKTNWVNNQRFYIIGGIVTFIGLGVVYLRKRYETPVKIVSIQNADQEKHSQKFSDF
jgi:hypothetical protein